MKNRCDILNVEWDTNCRDSCIVEPVLCYLELFAGLKVVRTNYESYLWKLHYYRPRLVLLSNYTGAVENTILMRQAHAMGAHTVSLISEGDVKSEATAADFFWGWNFEKENYLDAMLLWSERSKNLFLKMIPEASDFDLVVTGATGFDRYRLLHFATREELLKKYGREGYARVVCLASTGFDLINLEGGSPTGPRAYSKAELQYLLDTCGRMREGYRALIENHPDTLFLLKYHPGVSDRSRTEFYGLEKLPNTLVLFREENITDLINASDFLVTFESTTALETWLMGKQSIFFNPTGGYFMRSHVVDGSPEITSAAQLEQAYEAFYRTGKIPGFEQKQEIRAQLIRDIIGYDDGESHRRAAQEVLRVLGMPDRKPSYSGKEREEQRKELLREARIRVWNFLYDKKVPLKYPAWLDAYRDLMARYKTAERQEETRRYTEALQRHYAAKPGKEA